MPYRTPDASAYTAMKRLIDARTATSAESVVKYRAVVPYSFYRPVYRTNVGDNSLLSNKFIRTPQVVVDGTQTNMSTAGASVTYDFTTRSTVFEIVLMNFVNSQDIGTIAVTDSSSRNLLGSLVISVTPAWSGSSFTTDQNNPFIASSTAGAFPTSPVIRVTGAPKNVGLQIIVASVNAGG